MINILAYLAAYALKRAGMSKIIIAGTARQGRLKAEARRPQ